MDKLTKRDRMMIRQALAEKLLAKMKEDIMILHPPKSLLEWAIISNGYGMYFGCWPSRREAIKQHCKDVGLTWEQCRQNGDRAIKVNVFPYTRPLKETL